MNGQVRSRIQCGASAIALAMAACLFLPEAARAEGDPSLTGIVQIGPMGALGTLDIAQANGRRGGGHDDDDDDDDDHPWPWPGYPPPHPSPNARNEAVITQDGAGNTASIDQSGEDGGSYSNSGAWGHKKPDKFPSGGNSDNFASILQNGDGNEAAIVQDGSNLEGKITQTGNANFAALDQSGNGLNYRITQNGTDTTLKNGIILHDVTSVAVTQTNMGVGVNIAP